MKICLRHLNPHAFGNIALQVGQEIVLDTDPLYEVPLSLSVLLEFLLEPKGLFDECIQNPQFANLSHT